MGGQDAVRIFVGGLSWDTSERDLENTFGRFGKVVVAEGVVFSGGKELFCHRVLHSYEYHVGLRDTSRPRGFGFVTFSDERAVESAIREMHGQELGGRVISVNKAEPRVNSDPGYGHRGGSRGGGYGGGGGGGGGSNECFKCGRVGHWARECPSVDAARPKFDRYADDRYDRYDRYSGPEDRYPPGGRYGGSEQYSPLNGYGKERGYGRDVGPTRSILSERYGVGGGRPGRYEGGGGGGYRDRPDPYDRPHRNGLGGSYRERPGPYDRPVRSARPPALDDRY